MILLLIIQSSNSECAAEEGRCTLPNGKGVTNGKAIKSAINYPFGKPLEVRMLMKYLIKIRIFNQKRNAIVN